MESTTEVQTVLFPVSEWRKKHKSGFWKKKKGQTAKRKGVIEVNAKITGFILPFAFAALEVHTFFKAIIIAQEAQSHLKCILNLTYYLEVLFPP